TRRSASLGSTAVLSITLRGSRRPWERNRRRTVLSQLRRARAAQESTKLTQLDASRRPEPIVVAPVRSLSMSVFPVVADTRSSVPLPSQSAPPTRLVRPPHPLADDRSTRLPKDRAPVPG